MMKHKPQRATIRDHAATGQMLIATAAAAAAAAGVDAEVAKATAARANKHLKIKAQTQTPVAAKIAANLMVKIKPMKDKMRLEVAGAARVVSRPVA